MLLLLLLSLLLVLALLLLLLSLLVVVIVAVFYCCCCSCCCSIGNIIKKVTIISGRYVHRFFITLTNVLTLLYLPLSIPPPTLPSPSSTLLSIFPFQPSLPPSASSSLLIFFPGPLPPPFLYPTTFPSPAVVPRLSLLGDALRWSVNVTVGRSFDLKCLDWTVRYCPFIRNSIYCRSRPPPSLYLLLPPLPSPSSCLFIGRACRSYVSGQWNERKQRSPHTYTHCMVDAYIICFQEMFSCKYSSTGQRDGA